MKHQTIPAIAALAVLLIGQTVYAAPLHQTSAPVSNFLYDNFDDNAMDPLWWTVDQWGGPTTSETNGRLVISFLADAAVGQFYTGFYGACLLHGDFDMQVDYTLLNWPAGNGVRISLGVALGNIERVSFGPQGNISNGAEVYATDFYMSGDVTFFNTMDQAGRDALADADRQFRFRLLPCRWRPAVGRLMAHYLRGRLLCPHGVEPQRSF